MKLIALILTLISITCSGLEYETLPSFTIRSISDDGCVIVLRNGHDYFLYGFNGYSDRDYPAGTKAIQVEDFTYKTVLDSKRKIPAFRVLTKAEEYELTKEEEQKDELAQRRLAAANEIIRQQEQAERDRLQEIKDRVKNDTAIKVFKFRCNDATNGSPSAQYLVGMTYIKGEYPASRNTELGLHWIRKSAEQGEPKAIKFLEELNNIK